MAEMRDHVIIGGYGRVGQTIARVLDSENVPWVAFDTNGALVTEQREKGRPVYFGDASRHELLERAGARKARAFVVTLGSAEATERMVDGSHRSCDRRRSCWRAPRIPNTPHG